MDILYDRIIEGNKHFIKAAGLSTEVPPTQINGANLASGSQYAQVDAGTIQMFDGRDGEWHDFAKFDTGASASASVGGGLGGGLGGGFGCGNDDPDDPDDPETPGEGDE